MIDKSIRQHYDNKYSAKNRKGLDEGGWGGDESWGEPSSHDFSNDMGSVGDTGSSDAHDFSNDIGDVGNQGYTPPTPDESGLGDIGNINPYRGPSQIDNTDRINTALGNANAVSQLKNFTTTGNVTDLFKPNIPIWGMSYLYNEWKNRNNKEEEEQTSLHDPSINNLVAGNYSQNAVSNQMLGMDFNSLNSFQQGQINDAINAYGTTSLGTIKLNQGGRVGYFDGGIAGLL